MLPACSRYRHQVLQPALVLFPRKVLARRTSPVLRFAPSFARHRATGKERRARIDSKEGAQRNKEFFEISCLIEKISLKSRSFAADNAAR
ncbi:protein of unknown function [Cupriavidus taiwanensis]|uniref:Uncharacterized protein n=1 Tax=Cupriavidus taiwanensis TaxID=164546 RepID=A0A9Q7XNH5_9BURK|nr:protein of unknown function [Cupriavidus taiwanensis]